MIKGQDESLLAGVDDVDWVGLHHAYGSAEDVPDQLRSVCGDDEAAREAAFGSLFSNIFHQGTRYSASPRAVPFLARIAVAGPRRARAGTLMLLKCLAVDWYDEYALPRGINIVAWRAAAEEFMPEKCVAWYDEQLAVEQDPGRRRVLEEGRAYCAAGDTFDSRASALLSYDAVRAELPRLARLLDDPDPEVRTRTAYLLAWFPEEGCWSVPLLLVRLEREPDSRTAATITVAAGLAGDHTLVPRLRPWLDAPDPLLQWAAAIALTRLAADESSAAPDPDHDSGLFERIISVLTEAAAGPAPAVGTEFNEGNLHGYTARSLITLISHAPDTVLSAIADAFGGMPDRQIAALARPVVTVAFSGAANYTLTPFTDLGTGQQRTLRVLAENGPWKHYGEKFELALREIGLPDTQPALCAYTHTHPIGRITDPDDPWDE
ncbi:HEAT repeat domain-containing protein [Streptomyces sp. NPDC005828]|uniref:HEAT repeat domain-containing protein n=1 Tax=Streptomyces sp. NPDC005828 TaxID=3157071 RepID=UPI0033D619DC